MAGYGYEDATAWPLVDGSGRYVIDGDDGCLLVGQGCMFVDKETVAVFFLNYLVDSDRFDAMTPVRQHPPTLA